MKVDRALIKQLTQQIHQQFPNGQDCHIKGHCNALTDYYLTPQQLNSVANHVERHLKEIKQ